SRHARLSHNDHRFFIGRMTHYMVENSPRVAALTLAGVSRRFSAGARTVNVLDGLDLAVARGERVAVMGASGSGKSTLLNLAAGMDRPDEGTVEVLGRTLADLAEPGLTRFRARNIGLVFQDFNLI